MSSAICRLVSRSLLKNAACIQENGNSRVMILTNSKMWNRTWHSSSQLLQVQKESRDETAKDIDVQRDRPYEHLTMGQKGEVSGVRCLVTLCAYAILVWLAICNFSTYVSHIANSLDIILFYNCSCSCWYRFILYSGDYCWYRYNRFVDYTSCIQSE